MPFWKIVCFLAMYISLLIVGGHLFKATECPDEIKVKKKSAEDEREWHDFIIMISSYLEGCDEFHQYEEPSMLTSILETMYNKSNIKINAMEGEDFVCETWSLYNSIFFSFTITTTIGYGKVTPQTQLGRGTCFFYTIIGVPINCILITFIGNFIKEKVSELCL